MKIKDLVSTLQKELDQIAETDYQLNYKAEKNYVDKFKLHITQAMSSQPEDIKQRVIDEFFGWGPLHSLIQDQEICEILVNGSENIWFEKKGRLQKHEDSFLSPITFRNIMDRICHSAKAHPTVEHPIVDGDWGNFRLNFVRSEVHPESDILSLRRHPENPWTLEGLLQSSWCQQKDLELIQAWVAQRKNFLIIGPTSSGKTSVMNACLMATTNDERSVILEDSSEIKLPNPVSIKLLTRQDSQNILPKIDLSDLLRASLRLRPDRLVMGEMRGAEAKDFLMALSCGHGGSLGTLHAEDPAQALIRLEMLVQLGAPQWSLLAIRRLIQLSLDGILVTGRDSKGQRKFKGFYAISSLEETGFTLERLDSATFSAISCERGLSVS